MNDFVHDDAALRAEYRGVFRLVFRPPTQLALRAVEAHHSMSLNAARHRLNAG